MALAALLLVTTPILGLVWLGMRYEREQQRRLLRDAMQTLHVVGISRGRR